MEWKQGRRVAISDDYKLRYPFVMYYLEYPKL
jgi:hypothetical protein